MMTGRRLVAATWLAVVLAVVSWLMGRADIHPAASMVAVAALAVCGLVVAAMFVEAERQGRR